MEYNYLFDYILIDDYSRSKSDKLSYDNNDSKLEFCIYDLLIVRKLEFIIDRLPSRIDLFEIIIFPEEILYLQNLLLLCVQINDICYFRARGEFIINYLL